MTDWKIRGPAEAIGSLALRLYRQLCWMARDREELEKVTDHLKGLCVYARDEGLSVYTTDKPASIGAIHAVCRALQNEFDLPPFGYEWGHAEGEAHNRKVSTGTVVFPEGMA